MTSYRKLKTQIEKLEKQASDLLKSEVDLAIAQVKGLMAEYGLTAADVGLPGKVTKPAKATSEKKTGVKSVGIPMYADPKSGKTWTGKGKPPNWMVEGLKNGKPKADFLISKAPSAPAKETKGKTKPAAKAVKAAKRPVAAP